jgi:hypothetical protein
MLMKRVAALLIFLASFGASVFAGPAMTNSSATNRDLIIASSVMPVAAGKATLTIGLLQRTNGVYTGSYKINVSPYFYKSEKGTLKIKVPDESLATMGRGKVAAITGTATTDGKGGQTRHIDATATPASVDQGKLKLWFMSGDRKMTFEPVYQFAEAQASTLVTQTNMTRTLKRLAPVSHRAAETPKRP